MNPLESYLDSLRSERGASPHTVDAYRRDLTQYLQVVSEGYSGEEGVQEFLGRLAELAPTTVARKLAAVRGYHRFLMEEGLADTDPTERVDPPRRPDAVPKALEVDRVLALIEAPDRSTTRGRRDRALLEFLYSSAARISEALAVDLADLDLEERLVRLRGKGGRERLVPLGGPAVHAVAEWLPDRLRLAGTRTDALFLNMRGRRLSRQGAFQIVRRWGRAVGVEGLSPHTLRHSAATHMVEAGADLRTVQELLGHANVTTTQVYTRVSPQHLWEIYLEAHPRSR